jgi:hypothetical protein
MKHIKLAVAVAALGLSAVLLGCIYSATFTINYLVEDLSAGTDIQFATVDITDEDDWQEHGDDIDQIEHVGFELWYSNTEIVDAVNFSLYVDSWGSDTLDTFEDIDSLATVVIDGLVVQNGLDQHTTFGESLNLIRNLETLKSYAQTGHFYFYAVSENPGPGGDFTLDSVRVIVTFSGSL